MAEQNNFPPAPTPAEMSLLLQGLGVIYERIGKVESQIKELDRKIPDLGDEDAIDQYLNSVRTFQGALQPLTGGPQIHGGINTITLPDTNPIGRIYGNNNGLERFVIVSAVALREASLVQYNNLNSTIDTPFEANTHDLGTGYSHASNPASVFSSDQFVELEVPSQGPGEPPAGVFRRYYKVQQVVAGTPSSVGLLYREWFINGEGNEQWLDHYVFLSSYQEPDVTAQAVLKFTKETTGIPVSTQDFLDKAHDFLDDLGNPAAFYAHLELEWKLFGV